jgi:hypothetical protein
MKGERPPWKLASAVRPSEDTELWTRRGLRHSRR